MSKVFNMVGGGGKNVSSIVITGLESTDTVTCTKDGTSYPAIWDSASKKWQIVKLPFGTFTLIATNGPHTVTKNVLIDIAGVYEVELSFVLWLYNEGDEREEVTGGWFAYNDSSTWSVFYTAKAIDLTGMTYVGWKYLATSGDSYRAKTFVTYSNNPPEELHRGDTDYNIIYPTSLGSINTDIAGNSKLLVSHICVGVENGSSSRGQATKNSDSLYNYIYQSSTYQYSLKLYKLVFGPSEELVKKALGVS